MTNPPNDRRPRHGLSSPKQHELLTPPSVFSAPSGLLGGRSWGRDGLDRLPPFSRKPCPRRGLSRLNHFFSSSCRNLFHPRCNQFHHNNSKHKTTRYITIPNSALRMGCFNYGCTFTPFPPRFSCRHYYATNRPKPKYRIF